MSELISVIVPIYNVERYLEKCLESIIAQTYKNIEILLINDGSPDDCEEICMSFARKDGRIKYYKKVNGGLSSARNYGIERAKGDYIVFIDSDDYVGERYIESMYGAVKESGAEVCVCGYYIVRDGEEGETREKRKMPIPLKGRLVTGLEIMTAAGKRGGDPYIVVWNKLYKRELFKRLKFIPGRIHEDEFLFHHMFSAVGSIYCLDECLYYYRHRRGSITTGGISLKSLDKVRAFKDRVDFYTKKGYRELIPAAYQTYMYVLCEARCELDFSKKENEAEWRMLKREYNEDWGKALSSGFVMVVLRYYFAMLFPSLYYKMVRAVRKRRDAREKENCNFWRKF